MHANLDRLIPVDELRAWLMAAYGVPVESVAVCEDYGALDRQPPVIARMRRESQGAFPVALEVFNEFGDNDRVEFYAPRIQALCRHFGLRAVISDESPDPYAWVLVDERGDCSWVEVDTEALDERSEIVVRGPCAASHGSIATIEPMHESSVVAAVAMACHVEERQVVVETWTEERREGGVSADGTYAIVGTAHYRHFAQVRLLRDSRPWRPQRDAAREWIEQGIHVARRLGVSLCIHHEAFGRTRNIPGGSDSDEHCYHWDGSALACVKFKACRERW